MLKYSSNVIEKCLEFLDDEVITAFVEEVCIDNGVLGKFNFFNNLCRPDEE